MGEALLGARRVACGCGWVLVAGGLTLGKTRGDVAIALQADPNEVSRIEQRPDFVLETTRRYAEALGARCEVAFVFADGRRILIA